MSDRIMRLFLVGYVYPPEVQSMGVMLKELAEDLAARGHRVTVLTGWPNHPAGILFEGWRARFRDARDEPAGFRLIRCGHSIHPRTSLCWRMWHYFSFAVSSFINGLVSGPCDAVVCMSTPIFGTWSCRLLAFLKRARFIYEIDDLHPEAARNAGMLSEGLVFNILRKLDTALCNSSDAVVTLSGRLKQCLIARGIKDTRLEIVPFWMDSRKIAPGPRYNSWRRQLGIGPEKFVALYAGTIGLVSGAGMLIDVADKLRDRPDILLLCVGEGAIKNSLQARAAELGLPNLRFLPFQPEELLSQVQSSADVGLVTLLPQAGDSSIPSKVLGYMAAARAVIASVQEDSDLAAMLREGNCGIVTPAQDAEALAQAIRQAADQPDRLRLLGENARQHLLKKFGRIECTQQYERLISQVTFGPGRG